MTSEETHNIIIQITALNQCLIHSIDSVDFEGMNPDIKRIFKDSKDIFKAVNNHCVKKLAFLYNEFYEVDPNTIDVLISQYEKKFKELAELKLKDLVNVTDAPV